MMRLLLVAWSLRLRAAGWTLQLSPTPSSGTTTLPRGGGLMIPTALLVPYDGEVGIYTVPMALRELVK